ncbi:alpha/beta hydrolase [Polyangium aurulentum]|uniref:alpha/beta hydrolase n=1 Tax=Polyangium aurulentum TaxID=2567896 RepID=UPI0010AED547|nr:alpha/beta hydrolase-fold protein [Polyangium aurulentum]UQA58520.1 alpha/beta hydrolase [Polyangium aurulentum]
MSVPYLVKVHHPQTDGTIVLRADVDWERDIEAKSRSEDGTVWEFEVHTDATFFYFKPCIRDASGDLRWSVGSNYLAVTTTSDAREIYPHFFGESHGTITPPFDVPEPLVGGTRRVRVYLPPGYDENTLKRYPILYMHDGANLFFPEEAFLGSDWDVDSMMNMLDAMNVIDKVIVVGVYSRDRMQEYTKPGYESYGRFLVETLKPLLESHLRILGGAENSAVMGSSLGGLVSLYLAWQWPEVFGKAACLSSTFFYQNDLYQRIGTEPRRDIRIYLDSGWPEDNYEVTRSMHSLLLSRGYEDGRDVAYHAFPRALHDEQSWGLRSHIPFQFLFRKTRDLFAAP